MNILDKPSIKEYLSFISNRDLDSIAYAGLSIEESLVYFNMKYKMSFNEELSIGNICTFHKGQLGRNKILKIISSLEQKGLIKIVKIGKEGVIIFCLSKVALDRLNEPINFARFENFWNTYRFTQRAHRFIRRARNRLSIYSAGTSIYSAGTSIYSTGTFIPFCQWIDGQTSFVNFTHLFCPSRYDRLVNRVISCLLETTCDLWREANEFKFSDRIKEDKFEFGGQKLPVKRAEQTKIYNIYLYIYYINKKKYDVCEKIHIDSARQYSWISFLEEVDSYLTEEINSIKENLDLLFILYESLYSKFYKKDFDMKSFFTDVTTFSKLKTKLKSLA